MPNPVSYFELGGRHAGKLREFSRSCSAGDRTLRAGRGVRGVLPRRGDGGRDRRRHHSDQRRDAAQLSDGLRNCGRPAGLP